MKVPESIFTLAPIFVKSDVRIYRNGVNGKLSLDRNRKRVEDLASDPNAIPEDAYPGYQRKESSQIRLRSKYPRRIKTQPARKPFLLWVIILRIASMAGLEICARE